MRRPLILCCLLLAGCTTSFTNVVRVSLAGKPDGGPRLAAIADQVGLDNQLSNNLVEPGPSFRRRYLGAPYHLYLFEIRQVAGKEIGVFVHEAMMARKDNRHEDPERQFLEKAKVAFGTDTVKASAEGKGSSDPDAKPPFVASNRNSPETVKRIADDRKRIAELDAEAVHLKQQTTLPSLTPEQQDAARDRLKVNRQEKAKAEADIEEAEHPESYSQTDLQSGPQRPPRR